MIALNLPRILTIVIAFKNQATNLTLDIVET